MPDREERGGGSSWAFALATTLTLVRLPIALAFFVMMVAATSGAEDTIATAIGVGGAIRMAAWILLAIGTGLLALGEVSDLLDGVIARRFNVVSELGATLDPFADSISRLLVYAGLAYGGLVLPVVPLVMALRDITVAYSRILLARRGGSARSRISGKLKAWVQGIGSFVLLLGPLYWPYSGQEVMVYASWTVAGVTLLSSVEYVVAGVAALARMDRGTQ